MVKNRIAVTGIGIISSLGNDIETFWDNLLKGKSGIQPLTADYPSLSLFPDFFERIEQNTIIAGAPIEPLNIGNEPYSLCERDKRSLGTNSIYAIAAADQAIACAQLPLVRYNIRQRPKNEQKKIFHPRIGCIVGTAQGGIEALEERVIQLYSAIQIPKDKHLIDRFEANIPASSIASRYGLKGYVATPSAASATGLASIYEACERIANGREDVMIAGGTDGNLRPTTLLAFIDNNTGSKRGVCKPFDKDRDGTVVGEGSGIIVLENYSYAKKRSAPILAELIGWGYGQDAYDLTDIAPKGIGLQDAYAALFNNEYFYDHESRSKIRYVNAHGTGTEQNDLYECRALKRIFGKDIDSIFITSQKGALGHTLGAASTIELISTILSVNRGIIPPTVGLSSLDTALELKELNFPTQKTEGDIPVAVKEAIGFGGHNYVVAVSKGCY